MNSRLIMYPNKEDISNFFWSKSDQGVKMGGHESGRYFGELEIIISEEEAIVKRTVSNGVTATMKLSDLRYSNLTEDYQVLNELNETIEEYLEDPQTPEYQQLNRGKLLANVISFLPNY